MTPIALSSTSFRPPVPGPCPHPRRRRMRPGAVGLWLCVLTATSSPAWAGHGRGQAAAFSTVPSDLSLEPYLFRALDGQTVAAELGRLAVKENRTVPGGQLIQVAFVRFKSTSSNPGPPMVYLEGGPGGSGIDAARGRLFALFMALRETGDVIALDQRGTGMANPSLACPGAWGFPLGAPGDPGEMLVMAKERSRACAQLWQGRGVDLAAYNTEESADDLESLREALGVEKISLLAHSYGTHLALAAIRRHPDSIARAVLAGVEGPDQTLKLPGNVQRTLMEIDRLAKADPAVAGAVPDFLSLVKATLDRLERQPVAVDLTDATGQRVTVAVGRFDAQILTWLLLGSGRDIQGLPAMYYSMSRGDHAALARLALSVRTWPIGSAMSFTMDCASGVSPQRQTAIEGEKGQTLLGNVNFPYPEICEAWGNPDLGDGFRAPVTSTVPTLFISGTLDGRTPISNAEEVQRGFASGAHLVIEGAGHDGLLLSSPQIKDVLLAFLKGLPPPITRITLSAFRFDPVRP